MDLVLIAGCGDIGRRPRTDECRAESMDGRERPPAVGLGDARKVLSPGLLDSLSESRRIDNRRMREELGVALLYPTLSAGLVASLEDDM